MSSSVVHIERTIASRAADKIELFVQSWSSSNADSSSKAIRVLFLHGYLDHSSRYSEVAEHLCQNPPPDTNVTFIAYDARGHGKSAGPRGLVKDWAKESLTDLDTIIDDVTNDKKENAKNFLMGHSNGGLQVMDYVLNGPKFFSPARTGADWDGILFSSPFLAPAGELPWLKVMASKILGRFLPTLTLPTDLDVSHLMSDKAKQEEHEKDSMCLKNLTVGWGYQGLLAQARVKKAIQDIDPSDSPFGTTPILFAYAGLDQVASPVLNEQTAAKLESKLASGQVTVVCREKDQHEIFQEVDRVEMYGIVSEWLAKQ